MTASDARPDPIDATPLLALHGLSVAYGGKGLALDDVSLSVPTSGIVALLGANGAGKTTLIRAVSGLLPLHGGAISAGRVVFDGNPITGWPAHKIVRRGMGQVPEGRLVFKQLTVEENLNVGAAILPRAAVRGRRDAVYDLFPQLRERRQQAAGWLSGGEQQMLALGRALIASPRLLLIDELSLGLAPIVVANIYRQLTAIRQSLGTAILIVEQNAHLALEIADTAYVLERGEVVLSGAARAVRASDRVRDAYLGITREAPAPGSATVGPA